MDRSDTMERVETVQPALVHRSAHPSLAPVQGEQVVQFLLARNYYLTALEFLVESQISGHGDEVEDLQVFFSDQEKFPADELAKYQTANSLDIQNLAKEREQRLHMAEYELRLAKEDLAELQKRLAQQESMNVAPVAAAPGVEPGSLQPASNASASNPPKDLSSSDRKALNAVILGHLMKCNYKVTALTFEEEAAGALGPEESGDILGSWYSTQVYGGGAQGQQLKADPEKARLQAQLKEAQKQIVALQLQVGELERWAASAAAREQASENAERAPGWACEADRRTQDSFNSVVAPDDLQALHDQSELAGFDVESVKAMDSILTTLTELLPKLLPTLTTKARLDILPVLQTIIKSHAKGTPREQLVAALFNLVSNPDSEQREAIVSSCVDLAAAFGPSWTSVELLPLCTKNAGNQFGERRTLVADVLGRLVGYLDLRTQAHVVLTQLHRLVDDRLDQVRETAVRSVSRLVPGLQFSNSYFSTLEDMLIQVVKDFSPQVHGAALNSLLPALLNWVNDMELIATSLFPKVVADINQLAKQALTPKQLGHSPSNSLVSGYSVIGQSFSLISQRSVVCGDYQALQRLLILYGKLLPIVPQSALKVCPTWAIVQSRSKQATYLSDAELLPRARRLEVIPSVGEAMESVTSPTDSIGPMDSVDLGFYSEDDGGPPSFDLGSRQESSKGATTAPDPEKPFVDARDKDMNRLFPAWATNPQYLEWRALTWVAQQLLPDLLEALRNIPITDDTLECRKQFAAALHATCRAFGAAFSQLVLVPIAVSAAGCATYTSIESSGEVKGLELPLYKCSAMSDQVKSLVLSQLPRTPDALELALERLLPQLCAGLLLPCNLFDSLLHQLVLPSDAQRDTCWMLQRLAETRTAISFTLELHKDAHNELVLLLQQLVQASVLPIRVCAVMLVEVMVGGASREQMCRRVLPALMALLSSKEERVCVASISACADVLLQCQDEPKFTEQLLSVLDGQLSEGSHAIQLAVVCALARLASLASLVGSSPEAASQVDWVLEKVQYVLQQLAGSWATSRSIDQQKELLAKLVECVVTVDACEVKSAKLHYYLLSSLELLSKHKPLLSTQHAEQVQAMLKDHAQLAEPTKKEEAPKVAPMGKVEARVTAKLSGLKEKWMRMKEDRKASLGLPPSATSSYVPSEGSVIHSLANQSVTNKTLVSHSSKASSKLFSDDDD